MHLTSLLASHDFSGQTILVTGGAGVLGGEMARALACARANVVVLDCNTQAAEALVARIGPCAGKVLVLGANVLDRTSLEQARERIVQEFGAIDALVNAAGGNRAEATTSPSRSFFTIPVEVWQDVTNLNLLGTILPCQVFGALMAERGAGSIVNISSMTAFRPLTHVAAYSAAKAGISNFTQWLAVHLAQGVSPGIRVNAIAPGFFLTEQNRYLLVDAATGAPTPRAQAVLAHTPAARFGTPEDLLGALLWLLSPASSFVTGAVIPVDGGFSAFAGV